MSVFQWIVDKPVSMSSVSDAAHLHRGNNGVFDKHWDLVESDEQMFPWWRVDLGDSGCIFYVNIYKIKKGGNGASEGRCASPSCIMTSSLSLIDCIYISMRGMKLHI